MSQSVIETLNALERYDLNVVSHFLAKNQQLPKMLTPWLMKPVSTLPHPQGLSNPIHRIDTYLFNMHSNIVLPTTPRPPRVLFPVSLTFKI